MKLYGEIKICKMVCLYIPYA